MILHVEQTSLLTSPNSQAPNSGLGFSSSYRFELGRPMMECRGSGGGGRSGGGGGGSGGGGEQL